MKTMVLTLRGLTIHSFYTYFFPNFEWSHDYIWTSLVFRDFGPKCAFLTKNVKKKHKNSILFKMNTLSVL